MKTYQEMLDAYRKRQRSTVVDALATGLTYMDEIAVDTGLLAETGLLDELTGAVCGALPFAIIAVQEGSKVVLGLKPAANGAGRRLPHGKDRRGPGGRRSGGSKCGLLGGHPGDHGRACAL